MLVKRIFKHFFSLRSFIHTNVRMENKIDKKKLREMVPQAITHFLLRTTHVLHISCFTIVCRITAHSFSPC